ncbi:MAG: Ku protein [Verrucomicrobiaceae bacterium]|nr:Ku protein [Verrucomicrobiaceae bacterium]
MARPIWNGIISFGLLNVPVSLQSAEKRVDLHFRMIDSRTNKPIRYERVNSETGEEVPWKNIVQAFEYEKGNYVVLSKEEIAKAAPEGKETIEIAAFVERDSITPLYFEKPYYLLPGKKAEKGYVLLREILQNTQRVGIGHVIIRTRRYLCAVLAIDRMLVLNLLRFAQEVVSPDEFEFPETDLKKFRITKAEIDMATQLIDTMSVPWNPESYIDDHRQRLSELVEKQLASKKGLIHEDEDADEPTEAATNVVDFMALLKKSLQSGNGKSSKEKPQRKAAKKPTKSIKSNENEKLKAPSKKSATKSKKPVPKRKAASK